MVNLRKCILFGNFHEGAHVMFTCLCNAETSDLERQERKGQRGGKGTDSTYWSDRGPREARESTSDRVGSFEAGPGFHPRRISPPGWKERHRWMPWSLGRAWSRTWIPRTGHSLSCSQTNPLNITKKETSWLTSTMQTESYEEAMGSEWLADRYASNSQCDLLRC